MRLFLKKKSRDRIEFGILYGGIALLLLGIARLPQLLALSPACVFRGLTGIPCPACGSTRAVVHLSHGAVLTAFSMNPLTTGCMLIAALSCIIGMISLVFGFPGVSVLLTDKEKDRIRAGVVAVVLAQWIYLISRS